MKLPIKAFLSFQATTRAFLQSHMVVLVSGLILVLTFVVESASQHLHQPSKLLQELPIVIALAILAIIANALRVDPLLMVERIIDKTVETGAQPDEFRNHVLQECCAWIDGEIAKSFPRIQDRTKAEALLRRIRALQPAK